MDIRGHDDGDDDGPSWVDDVMKNFDDDGDIWGIITQEGARLLREEDPGRFMDLCGARTRRVKIVGEMGDRYEVMMRRGQITHIPKELVRVEQK